MSCKRGTYSTFKNYWGYQKEITKEITKENYFVSYAIRGPSIVPSIPINHQIPDTEPSSLNNRWKYSPYTLSTGIC